MFSAWLFRLCPTEHLEWFFVKCSFDGHVSVSRIIFLIDDKISSGLGESSVLESRGLPVRSGKWRGAGNDASMLLSSAAQVESPFTSSLNLDGIVINRAALEVWEMAGQAS